MDRITFPLGPRMQGTAVADLQAALQVLLDRGLLFHGHQDLRLELSEALEEEHLYETYGRVTFRLIQAFQGQHGLPGTGVVDERTAALLNQTIPPELFVPPEFRYLVRGQVIYQGGLPIPGLIVRAFHRELRREIRLGAARTDRDGNFEIYYNIHQIPTPSGRSSDRPPDLFVRVSRRVTEPTPTEEVLLESPTQYAAQRVVKLRLRIDGGASKTWSEYEQLEAELEPFLGNLRIEDLVEDEQHQDVTVLAGKLGQEPTRVAAFVAAHKLAAEVKGNPSVFYGLLRKGLPTNLSELLATSPGARSRALVKAIRERLVPGALVGEVRKVRTQFEQHAVTFAAADKQTGGQARLGAVLRTVVPQQETIDALVSKMLAHVGPASDMWAELRSDPELAPVVPDVQLTLQLAALTGRHLPVMHTLLQMHREGSFTSVASLARFSEADLLEVIMAPGVAEGARVPASIPGRDEAEKAAVYAATMRRVIMDSLPTQVIAFRAQADDTLSADVRTFWTNVTDGVAGFELGHGPVRPHLEKFPELLQGVEDREAVLGHLDQAQRMFNLTHDYDEQQVLRSAGLDSSLAVARLGQGAFLQKMNGTAVTTEKAVLLFEKASRISMAALELITQLRPDFNLPQSLVIPSAVKQVPNLETLFGPFNLCACDQCRSVHSPPAYLADLLAYLADRASTTSGVSARDILLARRPDLGEIELTCANTNTVLPYTDLVNEILERRIAPFIAFNLPAAAEAELNARTLSADVRAAFSAHDIELAGTAHVVVGSESGRWSITDGSVLYAIEKPGAVPRVTGAWPQTGLPAAHLAAVPEHVNPDAYGILRIAVYPWILPLELPTEEVRVFLDHLGCPRHELMGELFPGGPAAALDDTVTAAEYLRISDVERQYITGVIAAPNPTPHAWEYWGLHQILNVVRVFDPATNDFVDRSLGWLQVLGWVRQVLQRSGLEYAQLVRVLECQFVNPGLAVRIESADPGEPATCDISKLVLIDSTAAAAVPGLTSTVADHFTRFVRLWRKLGWEPEELDRVLMAVCGGQLNGAAIVALSHIARLRAAFGRSVDELISLWASIPTTGSDPLYHRLFLNPNVLTPVDPAFALGSGNELEIVTSNPADALISLHVAPILAALRIAAADLAALTTAGIAGDDQLNLANLSDLYRHALLAECLELPIPDLLLLKSLADIDPFDSSRTGDAVRITELVAKVRQSGIGVGDLAYLLFHVSPETAALAPPLGAGEELISEVRRRLKVIRDDTALRPDPAGERLARELAALRWPAEMVQEVIALLGGTTPVVESLDPAPAGFAVPEDFASRLVHDPTARTLTLTGSLTALERDTLRAAFPQPNYRTAIDNLFARPRAQAAGRMRAYSWPAVSASLAALPAGLTFPPGLRPRVGYDPATHVLTFDGTMTAADKAALDALSSDAAYQAATTALLAAADAFTPAGDNVFVSAAVADEVFNEGLPADRFTRVLERVLNHRRTGDSARLVIRLVADAVGMKNRLAERLLTVDLDHPTAAGRKGIDAFLEEPFASSDPEVPPTAALFPTVFEIALRMMKIAALVRQMKLSDRVIDWLRDFAPTVPVRSVPWGGGSIQATWLGLTELPAATEPVDPVRFAAWVRLYELARVGSGLPGGEATAGDVFVASREAGATPLSVTTRLKALTGWDDAELRATATAIGLALPQDLVDEAGLGRLREATRRLQRLHCSTAQALTWTAASPTADAGIAARRAVQAAYSSDQWPDAIRPLEETLRETRRAALVAYLVARPDASRGEQWTDTNGMYSHLLIDVETHPVVLTSRLKQAIGSTQLFVQRCLLNLEPDVVADEAVDIGWRQWAWMKQYRVWEANRKIFLFPENWIEPELRDDKSPFFLELENALLQADVTNEAAERAYATYLGRLDEVARLEVVGLFHQPGEGGAADELHVFARTHADPPTHFYRKWVGQARWTPWERLELDIPAGHLLPLVWNRRLYLFWPVFVSKSHPPPAGGDTPTEGTPYVEIQLAWSEYRQGRWGSKKTTPAEVSLESKIPPVASLPDQGRGKHVFRAVTSDAELKIWYESTEIVAPSVDKYGNPTSASSVLRTQGWLFSGCNGRITVFEPSNVGVYAPPNTHAWGMGYEESKSTDGTLQLPKGLVGTDTDAALLRTPGSEHFRLLSPHQEHYLSGRLPFFFHDASETLLVVPLDKTTWVGGWVTPDFVAPKHIDVINEVYYQPDPIPDPRGPIELRWDPVPVIRYEYEAGNAMGVSAVPVAEGLAKPVVPALATGKLALASLRRNAQMKSLKGTKGTEVTVLGDQKVVTLNYLLDPDIMFAPGSIGGHSTTVRRYQFRTFYHPYVCPMIRDLNTGGVGKLLRRSVQLQHAETFETRYGPTYLVEKGDPTKKDKYPVKDVDFTFDGAYAGYNWELFYHVPLMIACKLSQNQRFEEALRWFHAVFDPTDASSGPSPARYWRTRPFYEQQEYLKQRIDKLLEALAKGQTDEDLSRQLSEWVANPFRPFAVARVRTVAFQKAIVMKYLDNLIAWGDQLFRRDTIESINEATQLYILAAEILGPRPPVITPRAMPETHTFNSLLPQFAALTNALTDIEAVLASPRVDAVLTSPDAPPLPVPQLLYFCVPPNDKLLKYWDTVADRLFKIRNSLNLAGVRRTLPLFEPPIDPMLLVKAAAAGVDLSTAIADLAAPNPLYRFPILVQKAVELCQDVRTLGGALLSALERRDAEELARIHAGNEVALLKRVTAVKEKAIQEATAQITALQASRELAAERYRHYMTLLGASPTIPAEGTAAADATAVPGATTLEKEGVRMIPQESNELDEMSNAAGAEQAASNWDTAANVGHLVPTFAGVATPWGVGLKTEYGGMHVGAALSAIANLNRSAAADHRHKAQKASRLAEFVLRAHNWKLEANLAAREMARSDKDVAAARIREAMATTERDNHLSQVAESEKVEEHLRTRYTNRELYDWMLGQISAVYFQAYQLAYDLARRAEKAFRLELALPDSDFVRFGYWDSLRKGLLAGDRLLHDLRRMEVAYLDQNAREYEITKHVSLASLHPEGLLALQEKGACFLDLPEAIFDLDHPGHYLRRIKAVGVTVPCVAGPHTSIPCKLTLLTNRTRVDPRPTPQYALTGLEDPRFVFNSGGVRSIVTSSGRDDAGTFELNLRDERYLPFEGAGVISAWRLELPAEFHPFDYRTISDVVLHIRYTAREGGEILRDAATKKLSDALKAMEVEHGRAGLFRGFSGRHDFPNAWYAFTHVPDTQAGDPVLELPITAERFPAFTSGLEVKVSRMLVALVPAPGIAYSNEDKVTLEVRPPTGAAHLVPLALEATRAGGLPMVEIPFTVPVKVTPSTPGAPGPAPWRIEVNHVSENLARMVTIDEVEVARIDPAKVADLVVLFAYAVSKPSVG